MFEVGLVLAAVALYLYWRWLGGDPVRLGWPHLTVPAGLSEYLPGLILVVVLGGVLIVPLAAAGRSPHTQYRPSEIPVTFDDVVGLGIIRDEVIKTLNLFLAYRTFRDTMGGTPRRAILFEGPPGTGKTYMAKAMAREAAVPFLFVSASEFQSMYYGQTNRKIRSFFKALRKAAPRRAGRSASSRRSMRSGWHEVGCPPPSCRSICVAACTELRCMSDVADSRSAAGTGAR